jgi:L-asparagine transporter-like permease
MPELSRSSQPPHITMISSGAIIGAGWLLGSSAPVVCAGPAILVSDLIAARRRARPTSAALVSPEADRS